MLVETKSRTYSRLHRGIISMAGGALLLMACAKEGNSNPPTYTLNNIPIPRTTTLAKQLILSPQPINDESPFLLKLNLYNPQSLVINTDLAVRSDRLGVRINWPQSAALAARMGFGSVRIVSDREDFFFGTRSRRLIEAARKQNLDLLITFNPKYVLNQEELNTSLNNLFSAISAYPHTVKLEIGNEPDNPIIKFWRDQDLQTFAQLVNLTIDKVNESRPNTKIVIGALVDVSKTRQLLQYLQQAGVDTNQVEFAVHSYNSTSDVMTRINIVQQETQRPIELTELGSDRNKDLDKLIETGFKKGALRIFIHQLEPYFEGDAFFGLFNPDGSLSSIVKFIRVFARKDSLKAA